MTRKEWDRLMRMLGPEASMRKVDEEVAEFHDATTVAGLLGEAADIVIAVVSVLSCFGLDESDLAGKVSRKMRENLDRTWHMEDGVLRHD